MTEKTSSQKITFSTLSMANEDLHVRYEGGLERVRSRLGKTHPMIIGGQEVIADETFDGFSPINTNWLLGRYQQGLAVHADQALSAARRAFPAWSAMPLKERIRLLRRVADIVESRLYDLSALSSLEVGKNRIESVGEVQAVVDLIHFYSDRIEEANGFIKPLMQESPNITNTSVFRPYGAWVIISPFNFPLSLTGGPCAAALLAGNTVVVKPASTTPYSVLELVRCFLDAGLPEGVINFVTGGGSTVGEGLISSDKADGITFTGSYDVGMHIYRTFAGGRYPRMCIAEMGGKNPVIISRKADLDAAANGVMRAAFGLQGQKCSATSRVYIERPVKEAFTEKLLALTETIGVGDPTQQKGWMGPVIDRKAYQNYAGYCDELRQAGRILFGGKQLTSGDLGYGFFCMPTIADDLPLSHRLWKHEMFLPIVTLAAVDSLEEAIDYANDVTFGLTSGFFSSDPDEIAWFCDNIQAGNVFVNRKSSATTGPWPGYQSFSGWKGSGSTARGVGGHYYVQQYMREQSRTLVELE